MVITYSILTSPTLNSPTSGGTGYSTLIDFDWNTSTGGTSPYTYEIMVADNLLFTTPDVNVTGISDTNYSYTTGLTPGTTYYWKVRALDAGSAYSDWATTQSFTTASISAPTLVSPTSGMSTADTTPAVTWSASSGGSGTYTYEIMIDNDSGFGSCNVDVTGQTGTSYTVVTELPLGTYYIKLRAKDSLNNYSAYSSASTFIVTSSGGGGSSGATTTSTQTPTYNPPATITSTDTTTTTSGGSVLDDIIDGIMEPIDYTVDQVGEFVSYMLGFAGLSGAGDILGSELDINTPFGVVSVPYWAIGLAIIGAGFMFLNGGGKKKKKNTFIKKINRTVNKWV